MAPEVITQSHPPTTASDIWSVGCTLIELLTGYPPYFDMSAMSAIYRMANDDCPPLPDDISEKARDFLVKCFMKEPDERPKADKLLSHPWIVEHVPNIKTEISLPGVEEVRKTVKNFTLTKEGGLRVSENLRLYEDFENDSNESFEKEEKDSEECSKKKNSKYTKKLKVKPKKNLSKLISRKPKDKISKEDAEAMVVASSDSSSLIAVNIYDAETRRSIFTYTVCFRKNKNTLFVNF